MITSRLRSKKKNVRRNVGVDAKSEILGHLSGLNDLNAGGLEGGAEVCELLVVVELGTVGETARPGEDGGDGVGGGLLALLMHAEVAGDGSVGGLSLDGLSIGGNEDGGHETEGSEALGDRVGLDVSIVVLASPDVATVGLHGKGNHIVDETVLVPDLGLLELGLVLLLVDLGEDVLEATIVLLQDGVLGREVKRPSLLQGVDEARVGELTDGLIRVVHTHHDTSGTLEVINLESLLLSILGSVDHLELSGANNNVGGTVLVSKGMTTNNNGLSPARHQTRNVLDDDGLTEDGSSQDVTDGSVGGLPHLLKLELFGVL